MRRLSFFGEDVEQTYFLLDETIPLPKIGFEVDWRARSTHLNRLMGDQRACPAIGWREAMGLTLSMPYTAKFFRSGQVEVTNLRGGKDLRTLRFTPWQGRNGIQGVRDTGEERRFEPRDFPQAAMTLPLGNSSTFPMSIFVLGDVRLNSWILDSGVVSIEPAPGHVAFLLPLPNHRYPPTYSVGQAVTPLVQTRVHLKIALDLDFSALPLDCDHITIERGTPMIQWVLVKVPAHSVGSFVTSSRRTHEVPPRVVLSDFWRRGAVHQQLRRILHENAARGEVRLQQKTCTVDVSLSRNEVELLVASAGDGPFDTATAAVAMSREEVREVVNALIALGAFIVVEGEEPPSRDQPARPPPTAEDGHARLYKAIVDDSGNRCIWPADRCEPPGFRAIGTQGSREACATFAVSPDDQIPIASAASMAKTRADIQRTDTLVRSTDSPFSHTLVKAANGDTVLYVNFGTTELCFDDPELLPIGLGLVEHARFVAEDAQRWGNNATHAWETIKEIMDELVNLGLLKSR